MFYLNTNEEFPFPACLQTLRFWKESKKPCGFSPRARMPSQSDWLKWLSPPTLRDSLLQSWMLRERSDRHLWLFILYLKWILNMVFACAQTKDEAIAVMLTLPSSMLTQELMFKGTAFINQWNQLSLIPHLKEWVLQSVVDLKKFLDLVLLSLDPYSEVTKVESLNYNIPVTFLSSLLENNFVKFVFPFSFQVNVFLMQSIEMLLCLDPDVDIAVSISTKLPTFHPY